MNSPEAVESYELIRDLVDNGKMRVVCHLNFVEGMPMSPSENLPDLTNENGMFNCGYGRILKFNYSGRRADVTEEFKREIAAQLGAFVNLTGNQTISVDSHQHYLQIPMIFDALCDVVKENGYTIKDLRIPVDPMSPVWSTPSLFFKVPPINHVKWALLKFLTPSQKAITRLFTTKESSINIPLFFGIPFTCQMTNEVVSKLLPKYKKLAEQQGVDLELMFHPGNVDEKENLLDAGQEDLVDFYKSEYRHLEAETLKKSDLM